MLEEPCSAPSLSIAATDRDMAGEDKSSPDLNCYEEIDPNLTESEPATETRLNTQPPHFYSNISEMGHLGVPDEEAEEDSARMKDETYSNKFIFPEIDEI